MHTSHVSRLLGFVSVATAAVITVPGALAGAAQVPTLDARAPQPVLQLAARKGTRNYHPADADTSSKAQVVGEPAVANPLDACIETWDRSTHISKSRWREICKRQVKERQELEAGVVQ